MAAVIAAPSARAAWLVEQGAPRAEIIIAEQPRRSVRVAAHELRRCIEKISGARLPLLTKPGGAAVKIYVGESAHCPVQAEGLRDGAYRIVSGGDWLALIGDDADFTPAGPFAVNNGDIPRAQAEWEKIVGAPYGLPSPGMYKHRLSLPPETGQPDGAVIDKNQRFILWGLDERGSFNAVTAFLHRLGARWYVPGELGEILPERRDIELPRIDETVHPDFPLRQFNFRFGTAGPETSLWAMRLGIRHDESIHLAHGLAGMTNREAVFAKHPDWFAIYGGKPDFKPNDSKCQLCYSNESLFQETVRWARSLLDTFHLKTVSIMPPDGYTSICQCEKCRGKETPERGERGLASDHVWDFVNRVAKEVAKTHPKALVLNCAYGIYTLPPKKIDKLEPNVVVCIVGGRRPFNLGKNQVSGESAPEALRAAWAPKTHHPLIIFENYPFTDRGWYLPAYIAKHLGETINATKGVSQGEDMWLTIRQDFDKVGIGFNHFIVYFTARMYWGGKEADVEAMFREYCRLFYGPAEQGMMRFFGHCEQHWAAMDADKAKADEALALFDQARAMAAPDSVYARRLALVDDFLKGLRMRSVQLGQKRGPLPVVRLVGQAEGVVIDGHLDDEYWKNCPVASTGSLRELQTGQPATFGTTFKAGWQGRDIVLAIRCAEHPGEKPVNAATRDDDPAIWHGDAVEIQVATETHSYYQIAVSPGGQVVDLDRGAPRDRWFEWDSKAEVATRIEDGAWIVEMRLPVTQDENDPLHQIVGRRPIVTLPWHINICRQRVRDNDVEASALSPTGVSQFHAPMKFAWFYDGRSHQFEADPSVTDFALGYQAAVKARQAAPFLALAEQSGITDFQKSCALEQAAFFDREGAEAHIERVPIPAVKLCAAMRSLLSQAKAPELTLRFGGEDFMKLPFWKRGEALLLRGRAWSIVKDGARAEADLSAAISWLGDPRDRNSAWLLLGQTRETLLKDDASALAAYEQLLAGKSSFGGSDDLNAILGKARIQARAGRAEEALKTLDRVDAAKLGGVWEENFKKARAAIGEK